VKLREAAMSTQPKIGFLTPITMLGHKYILTQGLNVNPMKREWVYGHFSSSFVFGFEFKQFIVFHTSN
jgi:hypothetical protein